MKRSWRWYLVWGIMAASISMMFFMVTAGPAQAWSQWWNTFNYDFNTHTFVGDANCGTQAQPCVYWQEPPLTSVKLYFYMDPSLLTGADGVDFFDVVLNAFSSYNSISAWNPYMYPWASGDPTFGGSYSMGILNCGTLGNTVDYWSSNIEYGYNPQRQGYEYYSFLQNSVTTFNNGVHWDTISDYTFNSCSDYYGDAIETALHESGHVQGLGHTKLSAVMYPVASTQTTPWDVLQPNDIVGIQGIYPGNQQSS